jgi:hypothetical protein
MAEKPKSKPKPKNAKPTVMDVSKPGKSTPSASSRPVIVGHRPIMKDPMVNQTSPTDTPKPDEDDNTEGEKIAVSRTAKKVIAPITSESTEEQKDTDSENLVEEVTPSTDEPTEVEPADAEEVSEETPEEEPVDDKPAENDRSESDKESAKDAALVKTIVDKAAVNKKPKDDNNKLSELEKKRQAELDKLIEDRKYYVPVGQMTKKKRRLGLILFLLLFLAVAGTYLALDAQLFKNDIKLPYEFFKEQEADTATDLPATTTEQTNNETQNKIEEYKIPEGYTVYENKSLGFKFAYPKSWESWANILGSSQSIRSDSVDTFVYNDRAYDLPTYYDKSLQKWYTKDGTTKKYIEIGEDLLEINEVNSKKFYLFLGKGARYCGARHLLFEQKQKMILVKLPEVCSEDAKQDPDPVWNQKTYFIPEFEKDLDQVLTTYKEL